MSTSAEMPAGRPRTSLLGGEVVRRGVLGRGVTGGTVAVLVTLVAASSVVDLFVVRALPALLAEIAVIGLVWWALTKRSADGARSWAADKLEARVFAWTQTRTGGWWTPAWASEPAVLPTAGAAIGLSPRRLTVLAIGLLTVAVLFGWSLLVLAAEVAGVGGWVAVSRRRAGRTAPNQVAGSSPAAGLIPAQPTGGVGGSGWSMPPEVGRVTVATVAPPSRPQAPIAVLRHRDEPSGEFYSVALEIAGGGDGLRDVAEANRAGRRLGRFLYSLSTPAFLTDEVQLLTRTVPIDPARYDAWLADRLAPDCPPLLAASMHSLADDVGYTAEQHRSFLVLRVPHTAVVDRFRTQHEGDASTAEQREQARLAVLADEVRAAGGLANRCGLRVKHVLGPTRLAALIRSTYDPDHSLDDLTGASLGTCWPAYRNLTGRVEVGGWSHAVASVPRDGYPMGPVGLRMLEPLVAGLPGVVRTVSVGLRLIPRAAARRQARADHTLDLADATTERRKGRTSDGTSEAQSASSAQRLHDLMFDEAAGVRPAVRLLISARSPGQLSAARDAADTTAADAGFLRLDWHERRSAHAILLACPLGRGIRR